MAVGPPVKPHIMARYTSALATTCMPGAAHARIMIWAALIALFHMKAIITPWWMHRMADVPQSTIACKVDWKVLCGN